MSENHQVSRSSLLQGIKKWRLVQFVLYVTERMLSAVEYAVAPRCKGWFGVDYII